MILDHGTTSLECIFVVAYNTILRKNALLFTAVIAVSVLPERRFHTPDSVETKPEIFIRLRAFFPDIMLYVIKWLYAWVMPPALFLLVGLATVLLFCKTKKKYWLIWLPVLLYGLSIGPVSDRLIKPLENWYEQPELSSLRDARAIVVLGGGSYRGVRDFDGEGQIGADAANRLFMGLRLHKALHIPRSVMLFEREGVHVIPYPTDYKTDKDTVLNAFSFVPNICSLLNTTAALKEYLGIAAVKAGLQ